MSRFPEEINMLLLPGIERRSTGYYAVAGLYTRSVQSDGSHNMSGNLGKRYASIKQSGRLFFGRLLVSVRLAKNKLVSVTFE
jgi:hypothetical protein